MSTPCPPDNLPPPAELRLSVAFTGGVSLAIWMGGMAREMNLLLAASRGRRSAPAVGTSQGTPEVRNRYAALLELLDVDCSIDVLSGTSAGGINAVILGLASVQGLDLDGLRELWFEEGSLGDLLRDPADDQASSLLYGDKVLLKGLRTGLAKLAGSSPGEPVADDDPTRVFITTTLLTGEASTFTDEYGTLVRDTDHHGMFCFTGAQLTPENVSALALAARCSASFPLAFEPGFVPIGTPGGDGHPDMAEFTGTKASQFAADGGLLANRPLGPALQAVFDRAANREVRRVLAFVVPVVGGPEPSATKQTLADAPSLAAALAADVGAVLEQTISADLTAIAAHNQQVRARSDARLPLAVLGAQMTRLGAPFYDTYRARRADSIARAASNYVLNRMAVGLGADSRRVWAAADSAVKQALGAELPNSYQEMNAAGREPLDEGRATVLALIRRAYRLVSSQPEKTVLGDLRAQATMAMPERGDPTEADTFRRALADTRPAPADPAAAMPEYEAAAITAAEQLLRANMASLSDGEPWQKLATVVIRLRDLLSSARESAATPSDGARGNDSASDRKFVADLLKYLTGSAQGDSENTVATRLFDLHVARYAIAPDGVLAEQALELVQMSSDTRTNLDSRALASEKLTGLGLRHFGAFYKASWRANDWMWGRLDGAGWLVHLLLDPRRLHQLATESGDVESFRAALRAKLELIAGRAPAPGIWEPAPARGGLAGTAPEMDFLRAVDPPPPPTSLPTTAMWVAAGLQRLIAGEELSHIAEQIEIDRSNGAEEGKASAFLSAYREAAGAAGNGSYPPVPQDKVDRVLGACQVPAENIVTEVGTPLFNRTITRAVAVAVNMVDLGDAMPISLRPVVASARTVTTLAYRVVRVGPAARHPLWAGLILIAFGVLASTSTINVVSVAALVPVLAGLLLVTICAARSVKLALALGTVAVVAALAGAGYIRPLRDHLFPWLQNTVIPGFAKHPVPWAILVIFVLLPPIWTGLVIVQTMFRRRRVKGRNDGPVVNGT